MRAGEYLPWHGYRLPVGVEVEAIGELPVSVDTGVRVDGAEEVSVRGAGGREYRARPLGGLGGGRYRGRPVSASRVCPMTVTVTADPATAGNLCSAATSNAAMVTNFDVSGGVCSRRPARASRWL
ncbi:hypothetical protein EP51_45985 (plasmid) [Rhodococcus opacus]|uniref:Uncharacterized protein n=1 Tax=Rhodococcus opacus TaxID=37919 RepID=A0A076F165_RHOOP|nr:hypothetical protein EP51_45985 [Rhodococcus opacus]